MGNFGYQLPDGIIGEVGAGTINIIRTFVAKEDINFGEPVQIDHSESPDSKLIKLYNPNIINVEEPLIGVAAYRPDKEYGYYKAGDVVSVLNFGDIRVRIREDGSSVFLGNQVFIITKQLPPAARTSPYEFTTSPNESNYGYGYFVTGGIASSGNSFVINFDRPKVWHSQ